MGVFVSVNIMHRVATPTCFYLSTAPHQPTTFNKPLLCCPPYLARPEEVVLARLPQLHLEVVHVPLQHLQVRLQALRHLLVVGLVGMLLGGGFRNEACVVALSVGCVCKIVCELRSTGGEGMLFMGRKGKVVFMFCVFETTFEGRRLSISQPTN